MVDVAVKAELGGRVAQRLEQLQRPGDTVARILAPHLHFAIFALGPEKQWWKGTPINPYPRLGGQ